MARARAGDTGDTTAAVPAAEQPAITPDALAPTEFATLTHTEVAPGPGARVARGAAQAGSALAVIDLWHAFGWWGADTWTGEQAATRWPAITAVAVFIIGAVHNLVNFVVSSRRRAAADTAD